MEQNGTKMKKLIMAVLGIVVLQTTAFAGAVDPCRSMAYQACAKELQTISTNLGPRGEVYYTCNPSSAEFKSCESTKLAACRKGVVIL